MEQKLPLPPFAMETALQKVQLAEDAWNSKDPERVCMAYTIDTEWRNRTTFINGREAVKQFLRDKWDKELNYKLKKSCGAFVKTAWQLGSSTNTKMWKGNGLGLMAMKTGSLMKTD